MAAEEEDFVLKNQQEEFYQEANPPGSDEEEVDLRPAKNSPAELPPAPVADPSDPIAASKTGKDFEIDNMQDATELNLSPIALETKRILAKEDKVPFYLPFDAGEKKGATRTATINGYPFTIMKGEYVQLPKTVVKLFMDSMNMETSALNNNPFNLKNPESVNNPGMSKEVGNI